MGHQSEDACIRAMGVRQGQVMIDNIVPQDTGCPLGKLRKPLECRGRI